MDAPVFLDTSGLYAVFDADDASHAVAAPAWRDLVASSAPLHTSSYVLVECTALLQRRLGVEAVEALATYVLPHVQVEWVDEQTHAQALAVLVSAGRRGLSLVDCTSFVIMRRLGIRTALTVDKHFAAQGFTLMPRA